VGIGKTRMATDGKADQQDVWDMKIYLAHPYSKRPEAKRIQTEIERLGFEVINPFERGEQAVYDRKIGTGSDGTNLSSKDCTNIVTMDLEKIDQADFVVALLIDSDNKSIGTYMEIAYCGQKGMKTVISFAPIPWIARHPWIRFYTTVITDESKLYDYLAMLAWCAA
jgi:nucleoside 2-deoxyribosyltransferase